MYFNCLIILLCLFMSFAGIAQETVVSDSLLLNEVEIVGFSLSRFSAGSKIISIDSATRERYRGHSLSELLLQSSPVYLKTYGNGMLSTITLRGTSASHTAVLWNGININSLSLGQTDFSIVPLIGIDDISIQFGAGSALFGSDAIGGSINLSSKPSGIKGLKAGMQQEIGSFQHYNSTFVARYGWGKLEGKTAILYKNFKNNFPYINTTRFNSPREHQQNAGIIQKSFMQDIHYTISSRSVLTLNAWYNDSYREVQQAMTVRNHDYQEDHNLKVVGNYYLNMGKSSTVFRSAYLKDIINFNGSESLVQRVHTAFQQDYSFGPFLELKAGADWNYIVADIGGYGRQVKENRNDLFLLMRYTPSERFFLSFNIRQPFVTGFTAPLSPSVGAEYYLIRSDQASLKGKINLSKNFRVPTLNDRYWQRGGNKDLLPETSYNSEAGVVMSHSRSRIQNTTEVSAFYSFVENWITWIPGENHWSAENIKKVKARGIEAVHRVKYSPDYYQLALNFHYAYTRSTNESSELQGEIGKQLVYTPVHSGYLNAEVAYKKWFFNTGFNFTGQRFTTADNASELPPFSLVDCMLGRDIDILPFTLNMFLKVNNIADKIYHNYRYFAMPGRNYMLSLRVNF